MAKKWSREEEILAFALYCEIPFGKIHSSNPEIISLANLLERTPASVSMKMCNFGRFDPELRARGVSGLSNGSKLDEIVWNEFCTDWEKLVEERARILEMLCPDNTNLMPLGGERLIEVKARINQDFFRKALLAAYGGACCITGIQNTDLLIASHIKPWNVSDPKTERTSPTNGLILNAFHDRAFDQGFITVDTKYQMLVSRKLLTSTMTDFEKDWLLNLNGREIRLPNRFLPNKVFLEYHNDCIFLG